MPHDFEEMNKMLAKANRNPWQPVYIGIAIVVGTAVVLATLILAL